MRLSGRERNVVIVGGCLLAAVMVWSWIIEPVTGKLDNLDRKLAFHQQRYDEVRELSQRFGVLNSQLKSAEQRLKRSSGSILSHLETLANRQGVKSHIVRMKPKQGQTTRHYTESVVEIKMEKVPLSLLVRYLHQVENAKELLRIKELRIRPRFDNPNLLDVRFQVSSYALLDAQ